MASEESNRKVSSIFINLSRPNQTNVKQQSENKKGWVHAGPSPRPLGSENHQPAGPSHRTSGSEVPASLYWGHSTVNVQENRRDAADQTDVFSNVSPSPSPPLPPPAPPAEMPSYSADPTTPPPPPPPVEKRVPQPPTSHQLPHSNKEGKTAPSRGPTPKKTSNEIKKDNSSEKSRGVCAFCRKPILFSEVWLNALDRCYHKGCFRCGSCLCPLAGKTFYQKAEIPECEKCNEASLEVCFSCGHRIRARIIRALQRTYHVSCFICVTCKQPLKEYIQDDNGKVYCPLDYNRMHAKTCGACHKLIISSDGSIPTYVQLSGRALHNECYKCEDCDFQFSPESSYYPLNGRILCLNCNKRNQNCSN
ncbi:filamin-binding LIM protein 1 [Entelurus aequoreus]|uniref:filamin-binding LIM protein 1 n=1 Tax=Entelurus aequoreus TaxID=161455 RepID=UPI002B1D98C9|nr:filamin-binding LIM protein 1 [Entelurus aequoreus]